MYLWRDVSRLRLQRMMTNAEISCRGDEFSHDRPQDSRKMTWIIIWAWRPNSLLLAAFNAGILKGMSLRYFYTPLRMTAGLMHQAHDFPEWFKSQNKMHWAKKCCVMVLSRNESEIMRSVRIMEQVFWRYVRERVGVVFSERDVFYNRVYSLNSSRQITFFCGTRQDKTWLL